MSEKNDKSDEFALFRQEMAGIKPLKSEPRAPSRTPRPAARPVQTERDERQVMKELLLEPPEGDGNETGEELLFLRPGYQQRYLLRLRRGHYSIGDALDLHQMNQQTARLALLDFLDLAVEQELGCVRIVHGKGLRSRNGPKLKVMTGRLLRRHPAVIAFASCRPVDGGTGAVSVLLRDKRKMRGEA